MKVKLEIVLFICFLLFSKSSLGNISFEATDVPVASAIQAICVQQGVNYTISSDVTGVISKISMVDVSFSVALNAILKASGNKYQYRLDKTVYMISSRPAIIEAIPEPPKDTSDVIEPAVIPATVIEKIPLMHASPSEIVSFLNGTNSQNNSQGSFGSSGYNAYGSQFGSGQNNYSGYGQSGYGQSGYGQSGYGNYRPSTYSNGSVNIRSF